MGKPQIYSEKLADQLGSKLGGLAPKGLILKDLIGRLLPQIDAAQGLGYTLEEIVEVFKDEGVDLSLNTLKKYSQEIKAAQETEAAQETQAAQESEVAQETEAAQETQAASSGADSPTPSDPSTKPNPPKKATDRTEARSETEVEKEGDDLPPSS